MYTIEVNYTTGCSFTSETYTDDIGRAWEDIELARKALQSIKEHYELYAKRSRDEEKEDKASEFDWYKNADRSDAYLPWYFHLVVECDDGEWRQIPCDMWIGYFEELHSGKVAHVCEDGDSVDFY